jgi:transcriptional regulator of nitric oxide reductase
MNIIYASDNYYVVEYPGQHGYELVDKRSQLGTFFRGDVADRFKQSLQDAVAEDASEERVDDFLDSFDILLNQPMVVH